MMHPLMKKLGWLAAIGLGLATPLASASLLVYTTALSGLAEFPSNASPGTGTAIVTIDTVAHTMLLDTTFSGLTGTTTAAHIHCCTAVAGAGNVGVATQVPSFVGFPSGVSSGTYLQSFDLTVSTSWNPAFVAANGGTLSSAEGVLLAGLDGGRAYLNIHTTAFGGGEIRGFPTAAVPLPGTLALVVVGLAAFGSRRGRVLHRSS